MHLWPDPVVSTVGSLIPVIALFVISCLPGGALILLAIRGLWGRLRGSAKRSKPVEEPDAHVAEAGEPSSGDVAKVQEEGKPEARVVVARRTEGRGEEFDPYAAWLSIPLNRRPPNYYDLLGLRVFEDDADKIRSQGQKRFAMVHKYRVGRRQVAAIRLLRELSNAIAHLTDPTLKHQYDEELRAAHASPGADRSEG
jgi:hypothetical protein